MCSIKFPPLVLVLTVKAVTIEAIGTTVPLTTWVTENEKSFALTLH